MSKFLLLRWRDGHQEVAALDEEFTGPLRYYVIERIERVGRLALETAVPDGCPGLRLLERLPDELESVTVVGADGHGGTSFALTPDGEHREGDKVERRYALTPAADLIGDLAAHAVGPDLESIRRALDLAAADRQQDVVAFVRMLAARHLGRASEARP